MDEIIKSLKTSLIDLSCLAMGLPDDYLPMLKNASQKVYDAVEKLQEMTSGEGNG